MPNNHSIQATIFALATPPGISGVAVIRISGPDASKIYGSLIKIRAPKPRLAQLVKLYAADSHTVLDQGLSLYFPAPHSFTGEDVVELHTHGGRAVVQAVLAVLSALPGYRLAAAGEFTRRAFDNGKLDLTQIEGLADLIHAQTEAQRIQALRQLGGELGAVYRGWANRLTKILAHYEAYLDFPDEPIPTDIERGLLAEIRDIQTAIAHHLADAGRGERLREGLHIAIIGPPNAGKSSLLNVLAQRDAAIVSAQAGTTRDVIRVDLDLAGYPLTLYDTAGLRESADAIEIEGMRRTARTAQEADLRLLVFDAAEANAANDPVWQPYRALPHLVVWNKADLIQGPGAGGEGILLSTQTGYNLDQLLVVLAEKAAEMLGQSEGAGITRLRHRQALAAALDIVTRSVVAPLPELRAEDLRQARQELGRITGQVDVEDLLDIIFRDFCIGK
jgi:tRNA modification GTPase